MTTGPDLSSGDRRVPVPRPDVTLVPDDDGAVLVSPEGLVLQIDAQATVLWQLFDGEVSLGELADDVVAVFDVTRDRVLGDLVTLADDLARFGLVSGSWLPAAHRSPAPSPPDTVTLPPPCCGSRLHEEDWLPTIACRIGAVRVGVATQHPAVDAAVRALLGDVVEPDDAAVPANLALVLRDEPGAAGQPPTVLELHSQGRLLVRSASAAHIRQALLRELPALAGEPADLLHLDALAIGHRDRAVLLPGSHRATLRFLDAALRTRSFGVGGSRAAVDPRRREIVLTDAAVPTGDAEAHRFDQLVDWPHDGPPVLAAGRCPLVAVGLVPPAEASDRGATTVDRVRRALSLLPRERRRRTAEALPALLALLDQVDAAAPPPDDVIGWLDRHLG